MEIELGLLEPVARRLLRRVEALRDATDRAARTEQLDRLAPEVIGIRRPGSRHDRHHPFAACPRKPSGGRKPGNSIETVRGLLVRFQPAVTATARRPDVV